MLNETPQSVGTMLRDWRQRRRLSQLDLACEAEISTRHLSFLETGRSQPSRSMLMLLAERLEVPLRERNVLLVAAGFAPVFPEHALEDSALQEAKRAVDMILQGHEPYPALAVDRHWNLKAANRGIAPFLVDAAPFLLEPPINVLRLSLHPEGLAPRIINAAEWRAHILMRLRRQIDVSGDAVLMDLLAELSAYPVDRSTAFMPLDSFASQPVVTLQVRSPHGRLSFFSTTMIFGTPIDITLSELAIESFFPADENTSKILRQLYSISNA